MQHLGLRALGLVFALVLAFPAPCFAQSVPTLATVVPSCGTPPSTYTAGQNRPLTQDTTGKACNATAAGSVSLGQYTSTNPSSTITATGTFQSLQVAGARNGCLIQNHDNTHAMNVFFGPIGSATLNNSFVLDAAHGLQISCSIGGLGVSTDQVSITGTIGDHFTASFQ